MLNNQTDYKNLNGKVASCIRPPYLSGAGKTGESMRQMAQILGIVSKRIKNDKLSK